MIVKAFYYVFVPVLLVGLGAAVYHFGYPLFVVLAVGAALLGVFMLVGLTAIDLVKGILAAKPNDA